MQKYYQVMYTPWSTRLATCMASSTWRLMPCTQTSSVLYCKHSPRTCTTFTTPAMQSRLPLAFKDTTPKPSPSRQSSTALALAPAPQQGGEGDPVHALSRGGHSRPPRATGLGRLLSRMGMAGDSVAPEVKDWLDALR